MLATEAEGYDFALQALARGLRPDPTLWIDEWSEQHMYLPAGIAAEHGKYRIDRTPMAREILRALSPAHPCKRVVVIGASQLLKTQCGINWTCASIDQAPANMLVLLPTTNLAKRVSSRLQKTFDAVRTLRDKISRSRSRDSRNTIDTKEFAGGSLYITTAGSAANLAEVPARYIWGDEIARWVLDIDGEGDPRLIAEARAGTFEQIAKFYYSSSPTWTGVCPAWKLYDLGTRNRCQVPCPHCGEYQELVDENLHGDEGLTRAWMVCPYCAGVIEESAKAIMLQMYRWVAERTLAQADGETESFQLSKLYAPLGWTNWLKLARQRAEAQRRLDELNDHEALQVYVNTQLALTYKLGKDVASVEDLAARAEAYDELTVPKGGLVLTCGIDVQHDRLAIIVRAWGRAEESWLVYWGEIPGSTLLPFQGAWADLESFMFELIEQDGAQIYRPRVFRHASGAWLPIRKVTIDTSDGTASQDAAYQYCRRHAARGVMAGKGASERGGDRIEIFAPPKPSVDTDRKNKASKYGLKPYLVGTHRAKDLILEVRLPLEGEGAARIHWYKSVRPDYWEQLTSEVKMPSKHKRGRKVWEKKGGVRNEGLDCEVYALHAARALKIHLWRDAHWEALEHRIRQAELLADPAPPPAAAAKPAEAAPAAVAVTVAPAAPATERPEKEWLNLDDKKPWLN